MKIICDSLYNGALAARGVAVIIDVFRAFTCAPLLFSMGVEKLFLIATPEQAFALKEKDRDLILVGEVSGIPIKGFDFGNSPSEILRKGPDLLQRQDRSPEDELRRPGRASGAQRGRRSPAGELSRWPGHGPVPSLQEAGDREPCGHGLGAQGNSS